MTQSGEPVNPWRVAFERLAASCYDHFGALPGDYDAIRQQVTGGLLAGNGYWYAIPSDRLPDALAITGISKGPRDPSDLRPTSRHD